MSVSVQMPQLGESVTEGTVTRWLKHEGDHVNADEPLLEVSTDKVDTEIPSPVSGTLRGITVAEDETVAVGAELAIIDEDGAGAGARPASAAQPRPGPPRPAPAPPSGDGPYVTPLVRKLAAENGIDMATLTGTGVGGRIRKQDVLEAARQRAAGGPPSPAPAQAAAAPVPAQAYQAPPAAASSPPAPAPHSPPPAPPTRPGTLTPPTVPPSAAAPP